METAKISLWEVIIGIWILAIVVILGGIFFVPEPLSYALGEIAGSITASGLMVPWMEKIRLRKKKLL